MCDPTGLSEAAVLSAAGPAFLGGATSLAAGSTAVATGAGAAGLGISGSTIASIAAPLASAGLSMFSRVAANQQTQGLYIQNALNQNRALAQNYNGMGLHQSEIADKAATDNFDVVRGMVVAKGKAVAAAGEAGVEGVSFANVLSDLEMRAGDATGKINYNYTAGIQTSQNEKEAARSRADAAISGMPQANSLGLYAGIGADAVTGALKIYEAGAKGGLWGGADKPTGSS